jgi:hypothetical protein
VEQLTRVGNNHQKGIRGVLHHLRDDRLENLDVAADEIETGLARVLTGTGSDDDHIGVRRKGVVAASADDATPGVGRTVSEICYLCLDLLLDLRDINNAKIRRNTLLDD